MRRLGLVSIFVLLGSSQAAETISIATLNCNFLASKTVHVKYGLPLFESDWTDAQRAQWTTAFRDAKYAESSVAIAKAVKRIDADIIVLTEVGRVPKLNGVFVAPNDLTILHQLLADRYPSLAFAESLDTTTHQNVAVLSKRSFLTTKKRIPGRESYDPELDDPEQEKETQVSKGMSVVVSVDGEPFHIFAAHLKSERGFHESDAQRIAQASIIRRNMLPVIKNGIHAIAIGDLNDGRGQPALRRIRGRDDIDEDLVQTGARAYFRRADGQPFAEYLATLRDRWTYEYLGQRNQLDHILISQSVRDRCSTNNGQLRWKLEFIDISEKTASGIPATDHRAVKLTLNFLDD